MMIDLTVAGIILFDCLFLDVAYHSIGHLSANIIWRMTVVIIWRMLIMVIMVNVIIMINMFNIIITIIMIIAVITIVGFVKKRMTTRKAIPGRVRS